MQVDNANNRAISVRYLQQTTYGKIFLGRLLLCGFLAKILTLSTMSIFSFSKICRLESSLNSNSDFFSAKKMPPCYMVHKKIADQPCYNVIFYLRRTEHKY